MRIHWGFVVARSMHGIMAEVVTWLTHAIVVRCSRRTPSRVRCQQGILTSYVIGVIRVSCIESLQGSVGNAHTHSRVYTHGTVSLCPELHRRQCHHHNRAYTKENGIMTKKEKDIIIKSFKDLIRLGINPVKALETILNDWMEDKSWNAQSATTITSPQPRYLTAQYAPPYQSR